MASNVLHQVMSSTHTLEDVFSCSKQQQQQQQQQLLVEEEQNPQQEKRVVMRPQPEHALHCPRCDSTNTKFCYYNNYSLSQPRYFCKGCRRYWTQGGTLRNVPVGGGCRKNKRPSSSTSLINSCKRFQDQPINVPTFPSPTDLSMAFRHDQTFVGNSNYLPNPSQSTSFLDILRGGFLDSGACCFQQSANHELGGVQVAEASLEGGGAVKHEPCASGDEVGVQYWLQGGDGNVLVDPVRDYWGGLAAPWHGLVNSSLM